MTDPVPRPRPRRRHGRARRSIAARSCPPTGRRGAVRAGRGPWLWDRDGRRYLDFLSGLAVTASATPTPRWPSPRRAGPHAAARLEPVRHRAGLGGGPHPRPAPLGWAARPGVLRQLRAPRPTSARIKLARKFGGRGRHVVVERATARSTAARSPRSTPPASPQKHEAFQPLPEGFRHVAWNDLDALEAALDPSVAAVLLEPVQGEGGVNPATAEYFQGVRRLCDERGRAVHGRRGADRPRPHRARGSATSTSACVPDVVTMAKALGNGVPIGACWATAEVAGRVRARRPRHHLRRPAAGRGRGRAPVLDVMEREDVPGRAPSGPARACTERLEALPGSSRCAGLGLLLAAELEPGIDAKAVAGRLPRPSAWSSTPSRPTALRLAPPLLVTDDEIDEAARHPAGSWSLREDRHDAHLLEIDDLDADELREVLDLRRAEPARPRCSPARHGPAVREAVGPHAPLDGDGRGAARRPPGHRPRRRGRPRRARDRRGRRPHAGLLPRRSSAPAVFDHAKLERMARGRRRCRW